MEFYRSLVSPILDHLDSETMHVAVREGLHLAEVTPGGLRLAEFLLAYQRKRFTDPRLNIEVAGIKFDNPVLVGAGWDKKGVAVRALYQLGAAGVEVGSVLVYPQPGNKKPRQFVAPDGKGVALNRLGFNSIGLARVGTNLLRYRESGIPIGVSIGKNKELPESVAPWAYKVVASALYEDASHFVINVSSPNTPGLRSLQDKGLLTEIVQETNQVMENVHGGRKPLFVKVAPDLTDEATDDVIQVAIDNKLAGIIASNTTVDPKLKGRYGWRDQMGGLSGDDPDFRRMVTHQVAHIRRVAGAEMVIFGIGGVKDAPTALQKILAGANAVQVMTGLRGEGFSIFGKINQGLVTWMERTGVKNLGEIVGQEANHY